MLNNKKVSYEEIDVARDPALRKEMETLSGRKSVPQILIDGQPVGGCDELRALDNQGKLDIMLGI